MSKITNDSLTRSGTACFIAVPIWQRFVPNLSLLSDQETSRKFAATASQVLRERVCQSELQSVEDLWTHYKTALDSTAREVLGPRLYAKNYCNRTPIVKVIVENVVTCFFGTQCR